MNVRSIRISEDLEEAMEHVARAERIEKVQSLRKLARMGFECYVAREYREARLTIREAAKLLRIPLSETIQLFASLGVPGNIGSREVMWSLETIRGRVSGGARK
ncbi:MAG: hypothetical protein AB1714_10400 [Acidobacteriota bacterium]